ncbi:MAG: NAD(P)H-dependent oxidoreductase [Proteobacteria bacterium]|nr:NAD(P)H-dependent oxidoreductase [Pseudomonadota bacterium]
MNVLIFACSHRRESNSAKVASFVARALRERACEADVFDHGKTPLPIWTPDLSTDDGDGSINRVREQAGRADAFVCVVPEYSGMAAPAFKNIILMMSDEHMGHKPALLVGVSAGMGGAYPIAELRMSSYKNTRLLWIPENVIVRFADNFAQGEKSEKNEKDETVLRMHYALDLLVEYTRLLLPLRSSPVVGIKPYPFGV